MKRSPYRPALLFLLAILLLGYAIHRGHIVIPDRWNPWAPLRVNEPPNVLTRWKLMRTSGDDQACFEALSDAQMRFARLPDRKTGPGCGFENAVRIERTSAAVGDAFSLSCRAALSLAMWERHVLQIEAEKHFDRPVARIDHFGSYACRNAYGREGANRSRHATADALDIAGFVLEGGRTVRVINHWRGDSENGSASAEDLTNAAFLRAVHRGACRYFDSVLGPDYNAAHADHFHFDRGGHRFCR